jgi:hypothetical protein
MGEFYGKMAVKELHTLMRCTRDYEYSLANVFFDAKYGLVWASNGFAARIVRDVLQGDGYASVARWSLYDLLKGKKASDMAEINGGDGWVKIRIGDDVIETGGTAESAMQEIDMGTLLKMLMVVRKIHKILPNDRDPSAVLEIDIGALLKMLKVRMVSVIFKQGTDTVEIKVDDNQIIQRKVDYRLTGVDQIVFSPSLLKRFMGDFKGMVSMKNFDRDPKISPWYVEHGTISVVIMPMTL